LLRLTTDGHKASCGLSATAELHKALTGTFYLFISTVFSLSDFCC